MAFSFTMARTKQTARKSVGGKAPRKQLANGHGVPQPIDDDMEDYDDAMCDGEQVEDEDEDEDGEDNDDQDADENGADGKPKKIYADPGTIAESCNLYPGPKDKNGRWAWTTKYPTDLDKPVENKASAQFALLVRKRKCYDGRRKLELDSVVIQSQLIKDALGVVLKGYPGVTTGLARLEFQPPFTALLHRWDKFTEVLENETDPVKKSHIELLYKVVEPELREQIAEKYDLIKNGVMTFDMVFTIFEPGVLVYAPQEGHHRIFKLNDSHYGADQCGRYFSLRCDMIDFDGSHFGYRETNLSMREWHGTRTITKLSNLPLSFVPNMEQKKIDLIQRGHLFEKYAGYHFKYYDGIAIDPGVWGPIKFTVNSRIIIDTEAYNRFQPNRKVNLRKIHHWSIEDDAMDEDSEDYDAAVADSTTETSKLSGKLTDDQLLLCAHTVRGYSLRDKAWLTFYLDSIKDIEFSENAFSSLVAPPEQKELILAFAQTQAKTKQSFDDVIQGKGKGIIMLLSGPPGVGKTLTAESVAEAMKVPLYTMSAGDLGTDPHNVENNLKNILEMSTKWDAVLLLDEADVFLEARSTHDLERNKLVSIFLRLLEYYEGILFLTSNRVGNIDAAFESRIHLSLDYPELDEDSRKTVWRNFLVRGAAGSGVALATGVSEEQINVLAQAQLNGRQIKNILKTSQLLASDKNEELKYEHIQTVVRLRNANKQNMWRQARD